MKRVWYLASGELHSMSKGSIKTEQETGRPYVSTQHCSAVACIGDMQPSGVHQQGNGCSSRPRSLPCCAA